MNEERIDEELTMKRKLARYKFGMIKSGIGIGGMVVVSIGGPLLGNHLYNDPSTFRTMAAVCIPITVIFIAIYATKVKKYFELKKGAEKQREDIADEHE